MAKPVDFHVAIKTFAARMKRTCALAKSAEFHPEDQLKRPAAELLEAAAAARGLQGEAVTEAHTEIGRPDIGVLVKKLLTGYCELKAPGKGANPDRFTAPTDREQWQRFKRFPNLLYTDGNEWALYRTGERQGTLLRLGDLSADGEQAITEENAVRLLAMLNDFLLWEPEVPTNPKSLAKLLAPLCQLLREDVAVALGDPESDLATLAADWRRHFFPRADNATFADAYAQTLTYALLLSRFEGADQVTLDEAAKRLKGGHTLLADVLRVMEGARAALDAPISLLERVIDHVDVAALTKKSAGDPWLYFYEDFLGAYDPEMRKNRGVYYTPVEVVRAQVRLVSSLLAGRFEAARGFVDEKVITLDPACGTGTYLLAAVRHELDQAESTHGKGVRRAAATVAARNLHGFELLVGPYAVAHLRLTQMVIAERGALPADGVRVFLTNTLDSPYALPRDKLPLPYKSLGQEQQRARTVKAETPVIVCIGNPPYDRQNIVEGESQAVWRKGGWVRYGDKLETPTGKVERGILRDFITPLQATGDGLHAKNLYNDYVYFWRWALWKVFESKPGPGVVSFITAASYLKGPGFKGMRKVMRETFDELWIIDLGGDNRGTQKSENVFAIQTPVAIAVGVRYDQPRPDRPATVRYAEIKGTSGEKLAALDGIMKFGDLEWADCPSGWTDPFVPREDTAYQNWPKLTDLFPWQVTGAMPGRTWPVGTTVSELAQRWETLLAAENRRELFKDSPSGRKVQQTAISLPPSTEQLPGITTLSAAIPMPATVRFAYRAFDRQLLIADPRVIDRPSPNIWSAMSDQQVLLTSFLTGVLGDGLAAVATALIPDKDHFRGSFGGKHVIPLWRDAAGTKANLAPGVLEVLSAEFKRAVTAEDFFAYAAALLATPEYVRAFSRELATPGPHLPITREAKLFIEAVKLGRRVVRLHTFGERWRMAGEPAVKVGVAKCVRGTPAEAAKYPEDYIYDTATSELRVGEGMFAPVPPEVWNYSVSGLQVVKSWLGYRMRKRSGKKSSPLDDIRPISWIFDTELLELLWTLEAVIALQPAQADLFGRVIAGPLFAAAEFPSPPEAARHAEPRPRAVKPLVPSLFDAVEDGGQIAPVPLIVRDPLAPRRRGRPVKRVSPKKRRKK